MNLPSPSGLISRFGYLRGVTAAQASQGVPARRAETPAITPPARPTPPAPVPPPALDREDEADDAMCAARARERGRVAAILSSEAAKRNPTLAMAMALNTSQSRNSAIAAIEALAPADSVTPSGVAAQIIEAGKKARGETPIEETLPSDAVARGIVTAGRRARGEA